MSAWHLENRIREWAYQVSRTLKSTDTVKVEVARNREQHTIVAVFTLKFGGKKEPIHHTFSEATFFRISVPHEKVILLTAAKQLQETALKLFREHIKDRVPLKLDKDCMFHIAEIER